MVCALMILNKVSTTNYRLLSVPFKSTSENSINARFLGFHIIFNRGNSITNDPPFLQSLYYDFFNGLVS